MEISLGGWRFRTNPAENARGNVPYLCACQSCRNFLAAVETLPGETHAFFRRLGPDGCCDYRVWYDFSGELLRAPGDKAPYPAAPGPRVAFCPGEERRMAPLAGEVHMDAFLRLPFVLDEPWED